MPKLSVDLDVVGASGSFARGNENNAHEPDGMYYLGPGTSPGYGVVDLGVHYQLFHRVQVLLQINNLLNQTYDTAAQLGSTGFTATGAFLARPLPPTSMASFRS